jgi:hypothetical protein
MRLLFMRSDGTLFEQWYRNLVAIPTVAVPPSVLATGCCCGCADGAGSIDITTLDFSKLPVYPTPSDASADGTLAVGKAFTLIDNNNIGLPYEVIYVKKA